MKKLFILLIGMFLFISCEKEDYITYTSNSFQLADLSSVQLNLIYDEDIITNMFLTPTELEDKYLFTVDSICANTTAYFTFQAHTSYKGSVPKPYRYYQGALKINNGYLTINDKWAYILHFKKLEY